MAMTLLGSVSALLAGAAMLAADLNGAPVMAADAAALAAPEANRQTISAAHARSNFILHCAGCHQIDGSGQPNFGVPSMRDSLGYFVRSAAGRAFLVQVPGARNASITDAELAALTNWELQTFSRAQMPAGFVPYTAAEVTAARSHPPRDVMAARKVILQDLLDHELLPAEAYARLSGAYQAGHAQPTSSNNQ